MKLDQSDWTHHTTKIQMQRANGGGDGERTNECIVYYNPWNETMNKKYPFSPPQHPIFISTPLHLSLSLSSSSLATRSSSPPPFLQKFSVLYRSKSHQQKSHKHRKNKFRKSTPSSDPTHLIKSIRILTAGAETLLTPTPHPKPPKPPPKKTS